MEVAALVDEYRRRTPGSAALHERALAFLPGGDSRTVIAFSPYPLYIERARGCRMEDVDGNVYLDFLGNYTSMVHGHAHPEIVDAIAAQAAKGTGYAAATPLQIDLAELLCARVGSLDTVRFCNSGTEATLNALRAARAFTGRDQILKVEGGYHGSHDLVEISVAPDPVRAGPPHHPSPVPEEPGIPEAVVRAVSVAPFNDAGSLEEIARLDPPAAIILEPMLGATGTIPPEPGFLASARRVADEVGALLIFDEVITFRLDEGGAQRLYGVQPDLTALGKVIGGGLPVGAFGGRADIMEMYAPPEPTLVQSGTFNANPLTMAAGLAAMRLLDHGAIGRINRLGRRLADGLEKALADTGVGGCVTGEGSLWTVHFTTEPVRDYRSKAAADPGLQRSFHLGLLNRGIFSAPRGMFVVSTAMSEPDVDECVDAVRGALGDLAG